MKAIPVLREEMTQEEKELFLCDIKQVCGEYFECEGKYTCDIAETQDGFAVCILFDARRVKKFRKPRL